MTTAELILDAKAFIGEGPAWDSTRSLLYWVNIQAGEVHVFNPHSGEDETHTLGESVGCVAPYQTTSVVVALKSDIAIYDFATQNLNRISSIESHFPNNRFNDGKCDPRGRFLAGTMDNTQKKISGVLYSILSTGKFQKLISGIQISNGLAWSPDHRTLYFIDSPTQNVMAYDYNLLTGAILNGRVAISIDPSLGEPDGMTSDKEGMLWIAMWGSGQVTRWNPINGKLLAQYAVPALNTSSCVFGGERMNELYITSARKGLSASQLDEYPLSGGLFRLQTDVEGLPTFRFGGKA